MRAILIQDTGELGNRLVSYAYLLAYSAEHRVPVTNLCFWRYADLFDRPFAFSERAWNPLPPVADRKGRTKHLLAALLAFPPFEGMRRPFLFDGRIICSPRALIARLLTAAAARSRAAIELTNNIFGFT